MFFTKDELRPYQLRLAEFIKATPACALWVDMGLGKTASTLTALSELIDDFEVDKILVIAPLRVARKTWPDEIEAWAHVNHLKYSRIIGDTPAKRRKGLEEDADIYLINRENVKWLVWEHMERKGKRIKQIKPWRWDTLVIDESSSFKGQASERFKALKLVRRLFSRVIELTGTPAPNGYADLWSQFYILDRGTRLGHGVGDYRRRWFDPPGYGEFKWKVKPHAVKDIQKQISDITITMRAEDYLDLPPVVNNFIPVYLSKRERAKYEELQKEMVLEIAGKQITAVNAGVLAGKLLQLANGAVYIDDKRNWEAFHRAKLDALEETLDQTPGKVLLAYNFVSDKARLIELVGNWCAKNGKKWDSLKGEESEKRWDAGETDILLLHPQSGGHGLNLHKSGAETIIWYGLNWSLELYQQLNARLAGGHRRIGKSIVIHHIVTEGTIDEDVIGAISSKDATQDDLLNSMKRRIENA